MTTNSGPLDPVTSSSTDATVGDRVWLDADADGNQDAGEAGMGGVTVHLLDGNDAVLQTTATGADGSYQFAGLQAGLTYRLQVVVPDGYEATERYAAPADTDSNIDSAGFTDSFTAVAGTTDLTLDGGLTPVVVDTSNLVTVGDRVWADINANGGQDAGEPGQAGVTVELWVPGRLRTRNGQRRGPLARCRGGRHSR